MRVRLWMASRTKKLRRLRRMYDLGRFVAAVLASDESVQLAVVKKLQNQQMLVQLAGSRNPCVRRAVVAKLEDQKILARMALLDPDGSVRRAAARR